MAERRFSWTRFQVLVMLDQHGELYGAQIPALNGTLYPTLKALEAGGFIARRAEKGDTKALGRRLRIYYSITDAGRQELRELLHACGLELVALPSAYVEGAFPLF